jgi:hypothetical protein
MCGIVTSVTGTYHQYIDGAGAQGLVTIFFLSFDWQLLKTTREESKMSNFHTTLFQNSIVLMSWHDSPYIFDIPIPFFHNLYLSATFKQFITEFAVFEIPFHVVYMRSDWLVELINQIARRNFVRSHV